MFIGFYLGNYYKGGFAIGMNYSTNGSPPYPGFSLSLLAYLRVFRVWSALELPGEIQAIIIILILSAFIINESLNTIVSLDALNGICVSDDPFFFMSKLRMHSLRANRLLLISAPSSLLYLLLL